MIKRLSWSGARLIIDSRPEMTVVATGADGEDAWAIARKRPARRRPHGRPHAETRRHRSDEGDQREREGERERSTCARGDHLQPRRLRLRSAPGRCEAGSCSETRPRSSSSRRCEPRPAQLIVDPAVTRALIGLDAERIRPRAERVGDVDLLTARELQVLRLLAGGMSNSEIADTLFVTRETVKTYVSRLLAKLGLRDRVQAVVFAYRSGLTRST